MPSKTSPASTPPRAPVFASPLLPGLAVALGVVLGSLTTLAQWAAGTHPWILVLGVLRWLALFGALACTTIAVCRLHPSLAEHPQVSARLIVLLAFLWASFVYGVGWL